MTNGAHQQPLSVSEAMAHAKSALEASTLTLVGEVSELSNKPGYKAVYFTVKDANASMPCMMWVNRFKQAGVEIDVGSLVQLTGRFTVYAPKGRMNFDVFSIALAGEGILRQQVAERARKLAEEGLMDPSRKRALPRLPHTIGLVTSPRGAAVHDVLRTLRRRYPLATVLLAGVPVEGQQAPAELVSGLRCVVEAGAQEVLLVRGGGSFEDLMPFNDESLARCIAELPVPVITGIGHEPDNSIADMVADVRASTPTAAAEAAAPDVADIRRYLGIWNQRMVSSIDAGLHRRRLEAARLYEHPLLQDPLNLIATQAQRLDLCLERLGRVMPAYLDRYRSRHSALLARLDAQAQHLTDPYQQRFRIAAARLSDLSPLSVIGRGYAIVRNEDGNLLKNASQAQVGDKVDIQLAEGSIGCTVDAISAAAES